MKDGSRCSGAAGYWRGSYMFFGVVTADCSILFAELLSGRGLCFVDGVLAERFTEIR